jgi:cytochrome c-type biogenesis protein CcmH/NrfF
VLASGAPSKDGYTLIFWICVAVLVAGVLASAAVPRRRREPASALQLAGPSLAREMSEAA